MRTIWWRCGSPQKRRGDYTLQSQKRCREAWGTTLCHRSVLHQEEDLTIRWLQRMATIGVLVCLGVLVFGGIDFGEVMDPVWTRHRQEREEHQQGKQGTETGVFETPGPLP